MLAFDAPVRLVLPPPISTNNLFRNVSPKEQAAIAQRGGRRVARVASKEYVKWKTAAAEMLALQSPLPRFAAPVEITYFVGERGIGNMDADNAAKAATDALVKARIIKDDSRKWVRSIGSIWTPCMSGIVAVIEPAGEDPNPHHVARMVRQRDLLEVRQ